MCKKIFFLHMNFLKNITIYIINTTYTWQRIPKHALPFWRIFIEHVFKINLYFFCVNIFSLWQNVFRSKNSQKKTLKCVFIWNFITKKYYRICELLIYQKAHTFYCLHFLIQINYVCDVVYLFSVYVFLYGDDFK